MLRQLRNAIFALCLLSSLNCAQSSSSASPDGGATRDGSAAQACADVVCACFNVLVTASGSGAWTAHVIGKNVDCTAHSSADACLSRLPPGQYTAEFFGANGQQLDPSQVSIQADDLGRSIPTEADEPNCCTCSGVSVTVVGAKP